MIRYDNIDFDYSREKISNIFDNILRFCIIIQKRNYEAIFKNSEIEDSLKSLNEENYKIFSKKVDKFNTTLKIKKIKSTEVAEDLNKILLYFLSCINNIVNPEGNSIKFIIENNFRIFNIKNITENKSKDLIEKFYILRSKDSNEDITNYYDVYDDEMVIGRLKKTVSEISKRMLNSFQSSLK